VGACSVSEQVLRDEQVRSRRFREAWETQGAELLALRGRVAALEGKGCAGAPQKGPEPAKGDGKGASAVLQGDGAKASSAAGP
jgi:hypothetical protein